MVVIMLSDSGVKRNTASWQKWILHIEKAFKLRV